MKREKQISAAWAFGFSFALSLAGVMCIVTAFHMAVDIELLVRTCFLSALICSLCYSLPLGLVPLSVGAAILANLWQTGALESSLEAFLNRLSRQYNQAYGWGIIRWGYRVADEMEPDMVLTMCILGAVIALLTAWGICRRRTLIPALSVSLLALMSCFVVTDTVPGAVWLYLFLLCLIVLMMTGAVRRQDQQQGNRLCLWLTPTVALALLALFLAIPQSTYNRQEKAKDFADSVMHSESVQLLLGRLDDGGAISTDTTGVDLTSVGYRIENHYEILRLTAPYTGTMYLRGRAMDAYDGSSWSHSGDDYSGFNWPSHQLDNAGVVSISTRFSHRMLYMPYYADSSQMQGVTLGMENTEELTEYSFPYYTLSDPAYLSNLYPDPNQNAMYPGITVHLEQSALNWAQPLANSITSGIQSPYHKAQLIASFVRNSARYNTRTARMPAGERDFAQWFLEESDTGYCIHFATAATVLLQAAGIPARYVTGYMTQVVSGQTVTVYSDEAHAWAEYWLPGFGWTVLDATPADLTQGQQQPTESPIATAPQTPQQTLPDDTLPAATEPSAPEKKTGSPRLLWALIALVAICLTATAAEIQRRLRLRFRQQAFFRADNNEKVLLYWQRAVLYARLLKQTPPKALFTLAEKAKFSHHTPTDVELTEFADYLGDAENTLHSHNLFLQLYYRYILALYS